MSIKKILLLGSVMFGLGMLLSAHPVFSYPLSKTIEMVAIGYAPLDPKAIKGMCYSGDPTVTASGNRTTPGVTIAAPKHIPFGTWVHLQGIGWRRVDDRGKRITGNKIDICFHTRQEALRWGRRKVKVHIPTLLTKVR